MDRLLCLLSSMNAGGAETFLMKIYRELDKSKYQMDFCINVVEECFYEEEIMSLGGKIYRIPSKSENIKNFKLMLTKIVREGNYSNVLRITSNCAGFMDLKIAKKAGARICCARSSNSSDGGGFKVWVAHHIGRMFYEKYVDVKIAPSVLAAEYTFGKRAVKRGDVYILHNAVDLHDFEYDVSARCRIRQEFKIPLDVKVIGHVGRFNSQKNHSFLLDVFFLIHQKNPSTILLLVGKGELEQTIRDKVDRLQLSDSVFFAGVRSDVPALLSAIDVLLFPSIYEGMPNVVIEAQATGLPCVVSDTITQEVNISNLVSFLSLRRSVEDWAILTMDVISENRKNTKEVFKKNEYDIESVTKRFCDLVY